MNDEKTEKEDVENIQIFRTEKERDPLHFIDFNKNLLNSFNRFGHDIASSKALKKQLIATQRKLIDQQNKRIDYAFELCFSYEKQEAYSAYTKKIESIQADFSQRSAKTIDSLIGIMDDNIDRLYDRYYNIQERYKLKLEQGKITKEQYDYEVDVRFKNIITSAMEQTEDGINHLVKQYKEQTYLTLDSLDSARKSLEK